MSRAPQYSPRHDTIPIPGIELRHRNRNIKSAAAGTDGVIIHHREYFYSVGDNVVAVGLSTDEFLVCGAGSASDRRAGV
jgi:hypothetical protein